jgi:hypothetical protein
MKSRFILTATVLAASIPSVLQGKDALKDMTFSAEPSGISAGYLCDGFYRIGNAKPDVTAAVSLKNDDANGFKAEDVKFALSISGLTLVVRVDKDGNLRAPSDSTISDKKAEKALKLIGGKDAKKELQLSAPVIRKECAQQWQGYALSLP